CTSIVPVILMLPVSRVKLAPGAVRLPFTLAVPGVVTVTEPPVVPLAPAGPLSIMLPVFIALPDEDAALMVIAPGVPPLAPLDAFKLPAETVVPASRVILPPLPMPTPRVDMFPTLTAPPASRVTNPASPDAGLVLMSPGCLLFPGPNTVILPVVLTF